MKLDSVVYAGLFVVILYLCGTLYKLDSRVGCCATRWGIPVGRKVPIITLRECIFELFLPKKWPQLGRKLPRQKKFTKFKTYFEDYLEGFPKIPGQPKVSFIVSLGMNILELFLLKKNQP